MFEQTERELSLKELRLLRQKISLRRGQEVACLKRSFVAGLVISAIISGLVLLSSKASGIIVMLFFFALWLTLSLWIGLSEMSKLSKIVRELEGAVVMNRACATRITSEQMVEFDEVEDEGACYAFQVAKNKIAFVCGQDFYSSPTFPNTDFEIVEIPDSQGQPLEGWIEKKGQRLTPLKNISSNVKKTLNVPRHLHVIDGELDKLETLLQPNA